MANLNVKKGDNVMIIAGKDKGKVGEVLSVYPDSGRIVVAGTNMVHKHVKPRKAQEKGGIILREGTIDSSNVMLVCPECHEVVRASHKKMTTGEGTGAKERSIRVCSKCGASLEEKKPSAKKAAKNVAKKKAAKAKKDAE